MEEEIWFPTSKNQLVRLKSGISHDRLRWINCIFFPQPACYHKKIENWQVEGSLSGRNISTISLDLEMRFSHVPQCGLMLWLLLNVRAAPKEQVVSVRLPLGIEACRNIWLILIGLKQFGGSPQDQFTCLRRRFFHKTATFKHVSYL